MTKDDVEKEQEPRAPARRARSNEHPVRPKRSPGRSLLGAVAWTCCIVAILYGAAQALSRTAGFRSLLADRLSDRIGVPLAIGGSRLDWRLNVTLEDISTKTKENKSGPEVGAERVEIRWNWDRKSGMGPIQMLTLDGVRVRLVQEESGAWMPKSLAPVAERMSRLGQLGMLNLMSRGADAEAEAPVDYEAESDAPGGRSADLLGRMNVALHDAQVLWWSGGRQVASITGLDFLSRQVELPERSVRYYQVKAEEAAVAQGRTIQHISFEMLSTAGRNIVLGPRASLHAPSALEAAPSAEVPASPEPVAEAFAEREEQLLAHAQSAIQRSREPEPTAEHPRPAMEQIPTPVPPTPVPTPVPTRTPRPTPAPTATPRPLPTPTPVPTPEPTPVPVMERIEPPAPAPAPTVLPDPMEQALEIFNAAMGITNPPVEQGASDGLNDDESEALIRYIKDMLESED